MSIPFGLLGLLSRAPTHGYQLRSDFEAVTASAWPLNIGQVYSTLQRLERDGLVVRHAPPGDGQGAADQGAVDGQGAADQGEVDASPGDGRGAAGGGALDDGDRRQYRLTELGLERLDRWFASPVSRDAPPRDELAIKLVMAMTLPAVDARRVIDTQRAATMRGLQALTRAKSAAGDDLAASLVADAAIFHAEAEIHWLDHCQAGLGKPVKGV